MPDGSNVALTFPEWLNVVSIKLSRGVEYGVYKLVGVEHCI